MSSSVKANINAAVLAWARDVAGYDLEEAARKIGVGAKKLQAWELGDEKPTVKQLRNIANVYKRPTATFYLSVAPIERPSITDFRLLSTATFNRTPALNSEIRHARHRRDIALELTAQLGEEPLNFRLQADMHEQPEALASKIRDALGVVLSSQLAWPDHYTALRTWIRAIESLGVFVFQVKNIELSDMRGLSLSERPFPVIGINSKDSPRGRIFSLLHELVHIALDDGGVCNLRESESTEHHFIERYCNRVAGEILVPKGSLLNESIVINHHSKEWDDWQLKNLANRYMVSQEVILRRLLTFNKTTTAFYNIKHNEYENFQQSKSNAGFAIPYFRIIMRDNGPAYTNLIITAFNNDTIGPRDLSDFLGGIKLDHIPKIEKALLSSEGGVEI
jgi:Zn-dependent peptidase ImmA (M78 family)/transcriptional regulator with XRE-family HTH domain